MYQLETLPNGLRIVSENVPYVRTAAIGIFVGVGSRDERMPERGAAHFIEHMLFKGTDKYSATELAELMDRLGGQFNAFTSREETCFFARVPDYRLREAIGLLCDMLLLSRFDENCVATERGVICEEIDMYEDTPEDLSVERLVSGCFKGSAGRPVLGSKATLSAMIGESLRGFMTERYVPGRIIASLCGSFSQSDIDLISQRLSVIEKKKAAKRRLAVYEPCFTIKRKRTEQNHLSLGFPAPATTSGERYAVQLMSDILGGNMSSRLFQTLREKHGLCYSVYSFNASFADAGLFGVQSALSGEAEERALRLTLDEIDRFVQDGVTGEELERAREQIKAGILMGLESTSRRMSSLGSGMLLHGSCPDADELIRRYEAVGTDDILRVARQILNKSKLSLSAVGRVREADAYKTLIGS